jgi:cysteine desulfurase/selenocysteine lyase
VVTFDEVHLAAAPDRVEPGSPNTVGVLAMAVAMKQMMAAGMEHLDRHERELTTYALQRMGTVPGLRLYGSTDPERTADRVGVIPFNLGDLPHALVAAILAEEWGVGRDGCFCAHPYVMHLMGVEGEAFERCRDRVLAGDRSEVPGLVRMSLGLYNTHSDIDALVGALEHIARGEYREGYRLDSATGEYHHPDYRPDYALFYPLAAVLSDR